MGRVSVSEKTGLKSGAWTPEEDNKLSSYIKRYGHWNWRELPKHAGLSRCGKSCRLRWMNYLRPNIKRGNFTPEEDELIIKHHQKLGNRWSAIAVSLPGRTDNEIKNHWHTHLKKCTNQTSTSKERKQKPVKCQVFIEEKAIPLILESSAVVSLPPPKCLDFSSSSVESEVEIPEGSKSFDFSSPSTESEIGIPEKHTKDTGPMSFDFSSPSMESEIGIAEKHIKVTGPMSFYFSSSSARCEVEYPEKHIKGTGPKCFDFSSASAEYEVGILEEHTKDKRPKSFDFSSSSAKCEVEIPEKHIKDTGPKCFSSAEFEVRIPEEHTKDKLPKSFDFSSSFAEFEVGIAERHIKEKRQKSLDFSLWSGESEIEIPEKRIRDKGPTSPDTSLRLGKTFRTEPVRVEEFYTSKDKTSVWIKDVSKNVFPFIDMKILMPQI